jgi:dolichyl-phosphate-mannose-protein mannosyltransferase
MVNAAAPVRSRLERIVAYARREPGKVLLALLAAHVIVWTALPWLLCPNLQLDLAEDLALGKEWQLGYWKHPPLPWWAADLVYRLTGNVHAVYLLGPLAAAACMVAVWLLARDIVGGFQALIAVAALEGIHYYNFSVIKFAHDQMQLPFWALTGLLVYRAVTRERLRDWLLAGACLALAFWSKYAAFALAATVGLFLLLDPTARRAWRTPGPYLMALSFALVIAPQLWWLLDTGFLPFRYVDARAKIATHWYHFFTFPLQWGAGQLFFLLPAIGLLALLYARGRPLERSTSQVASAFDKRYIAALALGPFAVTTLVSVLLGRLPVAMWGYPLWSFAPLAAILWLGPVWEPRRLRLFAAGVAIVFVAVPALYAASEVLEPRFRDRPKATQFPGRMLAESVTRAWRDKTGIPLAYVAGTEFAANNVAVYSPDRPHVVVHGDLTLSPWVDPADLRRRGAVLVWEGEGGAVPERWRAAFPGAEVQPPLVLPRQTRWPVRPARIELAIVPPRP